VKDEMAVTKYLKKLNEITHQKIDSLREAKSFQEDTEVREEQLATETFERFRPLLRNIAKRAGDLAVRSAQNADSLEYMESAIEQLKKEHMDLWKSFSALLARFSSADHPDSSFFQSLLHDYDLRRSYVGRVLRSKKGSSIPIPSSKLVIKDFAERFGDFWGEITRYVKDNYTRQGKNLDPESPFRALKDSDEFREFYRIYRKYAEIKENTELITKGLDSMRYDFEDVIEVAASLEHEMLDKLGHYVMFYNEEKGDFHGLTQEVFQDFNVRLRKAVRENLEKTFQDAEFKRKTLSEFSVVWNKVAPGELFFMMEKQPIEIAFYILENKARRRV